MLGVSRAAVQFWLGFAARGLPVSGVLAFRLAERLAFERAEAMALLGPGRLFVPPPAKSFDHAWLISVALASAASGRECDVLAPEPESGMGSQKRRTAVERWCRRFRLQPAAFDRGFDPHRPVVFVDDVITSGATALAAYRALKKPHGFEVWTLAARPKLAGREPFC